MNYYVRTLAFIGCFIIGREASAINCKTGNKVIHQGNKYLCKKNDIVLSATSCTISNIPILLKDAPDWRISRAPGVSLMAGCIPNSSNGYCSLNCK